MASVTLQSVFKRYGENVVVKDARLDIEDGDFVVLVGPSGCGKSTMLRMIAGLESISDGTVKIGDKVVNDVSPRDRDIAMVFQSYALYPHMTVRDNIAFGLQLRKMPQAEIDKRVKEAAEILDIAAYLDRKPKQLSGGQRQRVAMGRAIVRQPAVFLFDEPLSNLDAKLRVQVRAEIAKLHQRLGTTTIYVTHDQVEAMTLAKHIVVMSAGVIQQVGAPLELYRRPANLFVATFIGSPSMNLFDVTATKKGDGFVLAGEGFALPVPADLKARVTKDGEKLVVGVRPEHLHEYEAKDGDVPTIPGRADVLEPLGAEVHVLGQAAGAAVTAIFEPDSKVKVGDTLKLRPEVELLHVFSKETSQSLRVEPTA
jgi:multiple sugar transport system ATP-binding protein